MMPCSTVTCYEIVNRLLTFASKRFSHEDNSSIVRSPHTVLRHAETGGDFRKLGTRGFLPDYRLFVCRQLSERVLHRVE